MWVEMPRDGQSRREEDEGRWEGTLETWGEGGFTSKPSET